MVISFIMSQAQDNTCWLTGVAKNGENEAESLIGSVDIFFPKADEP